MTNCNFTKKGGLGCLVFIPLLLNYGEHFRLLDKKMRVAVNEKVIKMRLLNEF